MHSKSPRKLKDYPTCVCAQTRPRAVMQRTLCLVAARVLRTCGPPRVRRTLHGMPRGVGPAYAASSKRRLQRAPRPLRESIAR